MSAYQQLLLGGFATAFVVGVAAQASSFCPQGGLREAMLQARPARLAAYAVSIAAALLGVAALQAVLGQNVAPARPPYLAPVLPWGRYVFGGLLFGSAWRSPVAAPCVRPSAWPRAACGRSCCCSSWRQRPISSRALRYSTAG